MATISQIENLLVTNFFPSFLSITQEDDYVHIIISHRHFSRMTVEKRQEMIYNVLDVSNIIILECFSEGEIGDLFETIL